MSDQATFAELHRQVDALEDEAERAERRWEKLKGDARREIEEEMRVLRRHRRGLAARLEALKHSSQSAWDEGVTAFERASDELRQALQRMSDLLPDEDA